MLSSGFRVPTTTGRLSRISQVSISKTASDGRLQDSDGRENVRARQSSARMCDAKYRSEVGTRLGLGGRPGLLELPI